MSEYWSNRHAEVCHAVDSEWEALNMKLTDDWLAAYRTEFRRYALERGWILKNIESGWLDDTPDSAMWYYGSDADPQECARKDVVEIEKECA